MTKHHDARPIDMAMRVVLMLEHQRQHVSAVEYVDRLMAAHRMSRATAYRYVQAACDALGLVLPKPAPELVEEKRATTRRLRGIRPGPLRGCVGRGRKGAVPRYLGRSLYP